MQLTPPPFQFRMNSDSEWGCGHATSAALSQSCNMAMSGRASCGCMATFRISADSSSRAACMDNVADDSCAKLLSCARRCVLDVMQKHFGTPSSK